MKLQQRLSLILLLVFFGNAIIPIASVKAEPIIPEGWVRYTNNVCGFTVYLPEGSILQSEFETDVYLRVSLPIFETETNLSDKYVEIECSFDPDSRQVSASNITGTDEKVFNQINFIVQSGGEVAAGNLYQADKYSAEQDGKYALLEFVLRSGNLGNYDPPVSEFDYASESAVFEEIMSTFTWGGIEVVPTTPPTPITPTPLVVPPSMTPVQSVDLCPYADLFNTKKELISYLEQPQLEAKEYNSLIPLPFTNSTRGYDESWPKSVVRQLESDCADYQSGKLTPEQRQVFEGRIPAFTRLTYTEIGIKGLMPSLAQMTFDTTKAYVETSVIGLELIFSITKIADVLEKINPKFADPVKKIKINTSFWILNSIYKIVSKTFLDSPAKREQRDAFETFMVTLKGMVDGQRTLADIFKDKFVKIALAEQLISIQFEYNTQINTAAQSVYTELAPGPVLTVQGSDQDAYATIQRVIAAESTRATESHQRTEQATGAADALQSASDVGEIVEDSVNLAPAQFIAGLSQKIKKWLTALDFFSQWLNAYATFDSGYNMIIIGDRMIRMDKIAFDPSEINNLKDFRGYQPVLQSSTNFLPFDKNAIPASVYYSKNAQRFYASIDSYDQRVQDVLTALQTGTDEQVIVAVDNLMVADGEVARTLRITEKPILGQNTNPQVTSFLTASQNFSSSDVSFQVALMLALANRTDATVIQQVAGAAQMAVQRSNELKGQYAFLTQPGLDLSITPSVVIANYELPATITPGAQIPVKITVNNPGALSFSGNISIRGGQVVSGAESPHGEVLPGQDKVFDITLQALQAGDEIVFVDLIQNGESVDSMMIMIQVKQEDAVVMPSTYGYWIAGGLGLLCLFGLIVGSVVFYTMRKTPSHSNEKSKSRKASSSLSVVRMKQALEFAQAKQYDHAFNILKEIVQSEPQNQQAWFNLGITLGYMENFKDAQRCLARAKQLGHPKADEALNWLNQKQRQQKRG